jgi:hypothetical protein
MEISFLPGNRDDVWRDEGWAAKPKSGLLNQNAKKP